MLTFSSMSLKMRSVAATRGLQEVELLRQLPQRPEEHVDVREEGEDLPDVQRRAHPEVREQEREDHARVGHDLDGGKEQRVRVDDLQVGARGSSCCCARRSPALSFS